MKICKLTRIASKFLTLQVTQENIVNVQHQEEGKFIHSPGDILHHREVDL